jgi:AraC-like DNA-binding protein
MPAPSPTPAHLLGLTGQLTLAQGAVRVPFERIFDDLPNVVFFIKDAQGRYVCANRTLVERCAFSEKSRLLGRRPSEVFPAVLAQRYERQDERVVATGKPLLHALELHLYPNRRRGWCLTCKYPVTSATTGRVSGVVGISRDLETSGRAAAAAGFPELAHAVERIQARLADPPGIEELSAACGLTAARFGQLAHRVFQLTPRQLVMKLRLDEALHLLSTTAQSLSDIALATGFCDQSAFTRHFRRLAGVPPGTFRSLALAE